MTTSPRSASARAQPGIDHDELAPLRPAKLALSEAGHVGEALKAARESIGMDVEDIAQATRVRAPHIAAIEAFDLESLPARPFVIGYVRAYARALGLDSESVVARFRAEIPSADTDLRAPAGLLWEGRRRFGWIAAAVTLALALVVAWNVAQHLKATSGAKTASAAPKLALAQRAPEPAHLGAPLPVPAEATTPAAYQTPGLASAMVAGDSVKHASPVPATAPPPEQNLAGESFAPRGTIYGAAAPGSGIVLQARKSTLLIVRGGGGTVYFAQQLAAGEAWRAPALSGLTADVGDPAAVEVFVAGVSRGTLTAPQTSIAKLAATQ